MLVFPVLINGEKTFALTQGSLAAPIVSSPGLLQSSQTRVYPIHNNVLIISPGPQCTQRIIQ
jgi:hypothetical protein